MKLKPRNPLVAAARFRRAGAHDKTHKAERRAEKVELLRQTRRGNDKSGQGSYLCACR
mgnify:CR=1 FL=1